MIFNHPQFRPRVGQRVKLVRSNFHDPNFNTGVICHVRAVYAEYKPDSNPNWTGGIDVTLTKLRPLEP